MILVVIYLIAGYWAAGVMFYENKIVVHEFGKLFLSKLCLGAFLGIIIIPAAIIKRLISSK